MSKWHVYGKVYGTKYLGVFEADSADDAVQRALDEAGGNISLCHQCSDQCEDGCVEDAVAEPAEPKNG